MKYININTHINICVCVFTNSNKSPYTKELKRNSDLYSITAEKGGRSPVYVLGG